MAASLIKWQQLIDELIRDGLMPSVIIHSWQCSKIAEVKRNPTEMKFHQVAEDELQRRLEANSAWLAIARPHVDWLSATFQHIPHALFLTDRDGIVLRSVGSESYIEASGLSPGQDWSETARGTNGAGTALAANQPAAVIGSQHFYRAFSDCACMGAPIYAPGGTLLGAIDISTSVADGSPERHSIVAYTAYIIGQELAYEHQQANLEQAEQSLRESNKRILQLADAMPQIVWITRLDGYHEYYNQRWYDYIGCTPEECIGHGWSRPLHSEDRQRAIDRWNLALRTGEPYEIEYRFRGKDGSYRWFLGRALPVRNEKNHIIKWFGTCTDIDDTKRLRDKLREVVAQLSETDRRKDEFLATLAHELRNPLAPLRTGLELMKIATDSPATIEEIRSMMERQIQQLIILVDDLLDVSCITRGKLELRKGRIKLAEVVQSAVEAARPFIDEAGHQLTVDAPDRPIYIHADPYRLAQVLSNLLNNAAKYMPEQGRIGLIVEQQGSDVLVTVKDNGIGIPTDKQEHIFELFAQLNPSIEKSHTGLGIGLPLVKRLVEMHGGRIEVHSRGLGQGSEFRMQFPILAEGSAEEPQEVLADEGVTSKAKCRVLIVDDNQVAADMLSMIVKMLGNEVRTAGDGQQAIEIAAEFQPAVVIMDIGMPKMNGYEAARQIRRQPWGKDMMLVALTGWGQEEDKQRTEEAGFDHHLVKPAEPSELQRLLAAVGNSV